MLLSFFVEFDMAKLMEKTANASCHIGVVSSYSYCVCSVLVFLKVTVVFKWFRIAALDISNLARVDSQLRTLLC